MEELSKDFFKQWPVPIDTTEVGFDILGIPEIVTTRRGGGIFEVSCSITVSDIVGCYKEIGKEFPKYDFLDTDFQPSVALVVADLKQIKMIEAVKELRNLVETEFSRVLKIMNDRRSVFYTSKEDVVQLVRTPVSYLDLAPGSTSIYFKVFTERFLGTMEDS